MNDTFCRQATGIIILHFMGYINFDKTQLINLEYALGKELVRSNRAGSYSCSTILGCNTRKYHGLLICPQPQLDGGHHVLLSKVDETIIQREADFNIGVNRFPGVFFPKGHKYVRDFSADTIPVVTYRVGGVVLTRETMFVTEEARVLIRYTLLEANSPTRLRIRPYLAFRNIHLLSKQNIDADTRYHGIPNGIKVNMYKGYSDLFIQMSKSKGEYVHAPDWYKDFEYLSEKERGYEALEDLFTPGFFETSIKKGEQIVFSASIAEARPAGLNRLFNVELSKRTPRNSFENCLYNSAQQFFYNSPDKSGLVAGYPWYSKIGRFTFISLPGIAMSSKDNKICETVIDSMISDMQGAFFLESEKWLQRSYDSADTSLWFFWALQKCFHDENKALLWRKYGKVITRILDAYAAGTEKGIKMHNNGLIHIDRHASTLTWMNAMAAGQAVTPRYGYVVEINALWYNALRYASELAEAGQKQGLSRRWTDIAELAKGAFVEVFWNKQGKHLSDFVFEGKHEHSIRPNQLFAISLPHSPLDDMKRQQVLDTIQKELLTIRGLRSLSPRDLNYKGRHVGPEHARDTAFHQGTVWPWLLGHFAEAWLSTYGLQGLPLIQDIYNGFQDTMMEDCIGSVAEIYEGDPPHKGCGAISFAPSVAELIRMHHMIMSYSKELSKTKKQ
jgi:predicted glycogen debranching enzyme